MGKNPKFELNTWFTILPVTTWLPVDPRKVRLCRYEDCGLKWMHGWLGVKKVILCAIPDVAVSICWRRKWFAKFALCWGYGTGKSHPSSMKVPNLYYLCIFLPLTDISVGCFFACYPRTRNMPGVWRVWTGERNKEREGHRVRTANGNTKPTEGDQTLRSLRGILNINYFHTRVSERCIVQNIREHFVGEIK